MVNLAVPAVKEKPKTTGYKAAVAILVLIIIGLLVFNTFAMGDKTKAEQNVKDLYKIITGSDVEIIKMQEQNSLYKVSVRFKGADGRDTLTDTFVTKDGMFLTDRLLDIQQQKSLLTNQSAFANCVADKRIAVLGISTDQATQIQLQVLGAFSNRLYVDCSGQSAQICQQLNITQYPTIFNNGTLVQGPLNVNWFEQNLGCYMTANGMKEIAATNMTK